MDNDCVCVLLSFCHCQFGKVDDIVDCQPSEVQAHVADTRVVLFSLALADRRWQQCRNRRRHFRLTYFVIEVINKQY